MTNKRLYNIWSCMRQRCNNPRHTAARWYHNRGVRVCPEWESSFKVFESWALIHGYSDELTIDRIDPDGNYAPENCRWIPKSENAKRARHSTCVVKEKEKATKEKATKIKKEPMPKRGRFMVVREPMYGVHYYYTLCSVIKTGLTKPEAGRYIKELRQKDPYKEYCYSIRVTDGYSEGDVVCWGRMRQYIKTH